MYIYILYIYIHTYIIYIHNIIVAQLLEHGANFYFYLA